MSHGKQIALLALVGLMTTTATHAVRPDQLLPDGQDAREVKPGIKLRKGSIAVLIRNSAALEKLFAQGGEAPQGEIDQLIADTETVISPLEGSDFFTFFDIQDWINDPAKQGNILIGVLLLETTPHRLTKDVKSQLKALAPQLHPTLKQRVLKLV